MIVGRGENSESPRGIEPQTLWILHSDALIWNRKGLRFDSSWGLYVPQSCQDKKHLSSISLPSSKLTISLIQFHFSYNFLYFPSETSQSLGDRVLANSLVCKYMFTFAVHESLIISSV